MTHKLLPYQEEGVAFLSASKTAMLADDPGLGKTIQAIRGADTVDALRVLIICPASLQPNWRREIAAQSQGDWQATIVSFNRAAGRARIDLISKHTWWDVCVIDEGHALKEITAARTISIYGKKAKAEYDAVVSRATRIWVLTGTPMPNHAGELYTHLRALRPDLITGEKSGMIWTYNQFLAKYAKLRSNGFGYKVVGSANETELHVKLKTFMLRRRKADVLKDLPPITFGEIPLEVDARAFPEDQVKLIEQTLASKGVSGLNSVATSGTVSELRRITGMAKAGPAADWVEDWLECSNKSKIVLFAHHKAVIDAMYDRLGNRSVRMYGDTRPEDATRAVDLFQNDPSIRVFIGNIQKAGVGITLTAASDLVFVETSWVPAEMEQAAQRIHRIGQKEACLVRFMHCAGTIDEALQKAVARKMESITKVIDGVK